MLEIVLDRVIADIVALLLQFGFISDDPVAVASLPKLAANSVSF